MKDRDKKDSMAMRDLLEYCMQALDKGDVEAVRQVMAYQPHAEKYLQHGLPFSDKVRMWVKNTDGYFTVDDLYREFNLTAEKDKNAARVILNRMKDAGQLIKHGTRQGQYRQVAEALEEMEWLTADVNPMILNWPLSIGDFFQAYPKNMGVIAGTKDSGKTAVLLDFVKRNMNDFVIHYYTNEMGKEELKSRIMKHEDLKPKDWTFHAYECTRDYEDHIARYPNDLHVIDYIEVNDNFYKIGDYLKWIHESLQDGFVLLGLQKDWGSDLGRGAAFSIQRPRLYITLERGFARCVSAKNRTESCTRSPVGDINYYGIINGWKVVEKSVEITTRGHIMPMYGWHPEMPGELDQYFGVTKDFEGRKFDYGT